jgi:hypothetical protein
MTQKKKFDMSPTREEPANALDPLERERFVTTATPPRSTSEEEPLDRMNFVLPRRLRIRFNQEAAARDIKKQALVREIFEFYFANK